MNFGYEQQSRPNTLSAEERITLHDLRVRLLHPLHELPLVFLLPFPVDLEVPLRVILRQSRHILFDFLLACIVRTLLAVLHALPQPGLVQLSLLLVRARV